MTKHCFNLTKATTPPQWLQLSVPAYNLLDSAYGESSSTLSLSEREARKNLVSTLITGTTHALGGEAAAEKIYPEEDFSTDCLMVTVLDTMQMVRLIHCLIHYVEMR
ncbi:hypothetical protein [unidentified bacterial endosymbiont]|uniref:hypothetical protein n=1 Tax=unidentified bacterial endosymbiont TaxID=2355 RepID=UPI0020A015EC|nr:hypothetical protein [unidentified bacterial endosymbiont]